MDEPIRDAQSSRNPSDSPPGAPTKDHAATDHAITDDLPPPLRADSRLDAAVAAFDEFMLRKGFSDNTIKAFRNDLKIVAGYLDQDCKLHRIHTADLEQFLSWMQYERGRACSAKTLARRITTLKVFFGWLHGIGVLGTDPAEPVIQQPVRTPLPIILRDEEVHRLLNAAQDYLFDTKSPDARPYLLVSLLLQTGIKTAECSRLLLADLPQDENTLLTLTVRYSEERHAHKNRRLPLSPTLLPILHQYRAQYRPETYLFECTPRNLEYVLDEVGTRARIRSTQVGFETLRWTCAVRDYRTGMPEEQLREKMGLSKISWRETRDKILRLTGQGNN